MKKYLIYIISVLLLVFSVNSILGPESSELTANSLTIIHPLYEIYQKNSNITFNFDVLNSNFTKLDNTQANCSFYFFNKIGDLLINDTLLYNSSTRLWFFRINNNNITNNDDYSIYVYCISSQGQQGFLKMAFEVTGTGKQGKDSVLLGFILLIPLFFTGFLLVVSWMLPKDKYNALKYSLLLVSFFFIIQSYQYSIISIAEFYNFTALIDSIGENVFMATTVWWMLLLIFLFTLLYDVFMFFKFKKRKTGEYE